MARPRRSQRPCRYLGAAALVGVGIDHIQQYVGASYSAVPTIGTLFALNFVSSILLAAGTRRADRARLPAVGKPMLGFLALSGIGVALGSLLGPGDQRTDPPIRVHGERIPPGDRRLDRARARHRGCCSARSSSGSSARPRCGSACRIARCSDAARPPATGASTAPSGDGTPRGCRRRVRADPGWARLRGPYATLSSTTPV